MSESLTSPDLEAPEREIPGIPLNPDVFASIYRLVHELPPGVFRYVDVVTREGDRRRITPHPERDGHYNVAGPRSSHVIDPSDPSTFQGLFILPNTLRVVTRDATNEGLERIREKKREWDEDNDWQRALRGTCG